MAGKRTVHSWRNESATDRLVRLLLGAAMLALGLLNAVPEPWDTALDVFAFVPLITSLVGWCPFYALFGFSSCARLGPRRNATR